MSLKYDHTIEAHNMTSPREIVPVVLNFWQPKSVVDVGCGLGTFARAFKENGVELVRGIDGKWVKKELLFQNIEQEEFIQTDLEKEIKLDRRFDLAVCLEVAEHLTPERGPSFVKDLSNLSDIILFGAAIPGQGGDNHLNEQWLSYWTKHFGTQGYEVRDILKSQLWNNENIFCWYKQNAVFFVKRGSDAANALPTSENTLENVIHPELYDIATSYKDAFAIKRALRSLYKAVLYKSGIIK